MKNKLKSMLFILTALVFLSLFDANRIEAQVTVKLIPPMPNQLKADDLWKVEVINTSPSRLPLVINAELKEKTQGIIADAEISGIILSPGSKRFTYNDFNRAKLNIRNPKLQEAFSRRESAPPGDYTICVIVKNDEGEEFARDCIEHTIEAPSQEMINPTLLLPENGATIEVKQPVIFTWMLPSLKTGRDVTYKLKIVEMMGNQSPVQAMNSNPAFYEKDNIRATTYNYPSSARKFEAGKSYAWQVSSIISEQYSGESEVGSFQLVPETECNCTDGSWEKLIVKYGSDVGELTPCDITWANILTLGNTFYIEPTFTCSLPNCVPSYVGIVQDQSGTATNLSYPFSYKPTSPGTYSFIITPSCGDYRCPPCSVRVMVKDSTQTICNCEDGYWTQIEATYPDGNFPDGQVKTADCGGTFIAFPSANIKFNSSYTCNDPECPVTYTYTKQFNGGAVDGPFPFDFPIDEWFYSTGTYVYTITPYCGEQACPPCTFIVEVKETPCGCRGWGNIKVTADDNSVTKPCGSTFLSTTVSSNIIIEPNYFCSNPGPTCPLSFHYSSRVDYGPWSSSTPSAPGPFTYVPNVPGYHEVLVIAQCGKQMCDSCIIGIHVEPKELCRCEDSHWLGVGVKYFDDNNNSIDKGNYQCDETVSGYASLGTQVSLQPGFLCYPDTCTALLNIHVIKPNGNPDIYSDPYNLQTYGVYKFVITPTCGKETCPPCSLSVIVRDAVSTCGCGEWEYTNITLENITKQYHCDDPPLSVDYGSTLTFEPIYTCSPQSCNPTFDYFTDLNTSSTSFSSSFNYTADVIGTHQVCIVAKCGGVVCDTCCFTVMIDSASECHCDSIGWKDVAVVCNNNTIDYDACGKTLTASKNTWIGFNPNFICVPFDCPKNFIYEVSLNSGPFAVITLPYEMDSYGTYLFEITAICGLDTCPPCNISVIVRDSVETCVCGEWNDVKVTYDPGSDVTQSCGTTFPGTTVNTNIKIETSHQCYPISPVCDAHYSYIIYNSTTGWNSGIKTPTSMHPLIDFTPTESGDYTFAINAVCDQDTCPCEINIHVDSLASQCNCGENIWKGMSLEIGGVPEYIPAPFCGTTLIKHANVGDEINNIAPVFFCNPAQSCDATFELYVQKEGGASIVLPTPYTFSSQGIYIFTIIPHCGNDICDSCSFKVIVDPVSTECGCDEGNWNPIEVKFNDNMQPGPILCGNTVQNSAFIDEPISIITAYNCYPYNSGCIKTYTYSVYRYSTRVVDPVGSILTLPPINYTPHEPGLYTFIIDTKCGQENCPPCSLFVNVESPCECGKRSWRPVEVKFNGVKVGITYNCNQTIDMVVTEKMNISFNTAFNCNPTNCLPSYEYTIYKNNNLYYTSNSNLTMPITYAPQEKGNYRIEIKAKCGDNICPPCSLLFGVTTSSEIIGDGEIINNTSGDELPIEPVDTSGVTPSDVPIGTELQPGDVTITGGLTSGGSQTHPSCPGIPTVTYQGKTYNTVQIGDQCWLKENLDVGIMIQGNQDQNDNGIIEKYCYNNNPANCITYGGLYQWGEAMQHSTTPGSQGICPPGWHIPDNVEFAILSATVNSHGNPLKAVGQGTGNGAGTNTTGFSALLAGINQSSYHRMGTETYYWSSHEASGHIGGRTMALNYHANYIYLIWYCPYNYGISVRCIKN